MKNTPKNSTINKCLHIYYSGSVQGVGFRYTAERIANSLSLTGWAKNLRDGRVEIMCEGAEGDIEVFLQKIKNVFRDYIVDMDMEWGAATGEFSGFDIQF